MSSLSIIRIVFAPILWCLIVGVSSVHLQKDNTTSDVTSMVTTLATTTLNNNDNTLETIISDSSDTENSVLCHSLCSCWSWSYEEDESYEEEYLTTKCSNRGFTEIPSDIDQLTYYLWLDDNQISVLRNESLRNLTSLYKLDLRGNQLVLIEADAFQGLHSLRWLWLEDAIQPNTVLDKRLLHPLVYIYFVGLGRCNLKEIPPDFFSNNPEVYCIDLSGNKLSHFPEGLFQGLHDTSEIFVDNNNIEYLQSDMFKGDSNLRKIELHNNSIGTLSEDVGLQELPSLEILTISDNPFSCTCSLVWFSRWIDSFLSVGNSEDLQCVSPKSKRGMKVVDLYKNGDCSRKGMKIGISVAVLTILGLILGVTIHRYRWDLRFHWFILRAKFQGWERLRGNHDATAPRDYDYDVFISYNNEDQEWVRNQLIPTLEGAPYNLKTCVDYRDFIFGKKIIDNILNAVQRSRKTLLILSPSFVESVWCYFELEMAIWRLFDERQDVAVMVLLEPIPKQKIPLLLKRLMKKRVYAKWTEDRAGHRLFWEKLVAALKSTNDTERAMKRPDKNNVV